MYNRRDRRRRRHIQPEQIGLFINIFFPAASAAAAAAAAT